MQASQYTRDAPRLYAALQATDSEALVAKVPLKVHIPARFPQRDLAVFEEETTFLGICAFILEDRYYAVSRIPAMIRSEPTLVNTVVVDDIEYLELSYDAGAAVMANTNLVKVDSILYTIFDELIAKGRVPWYFTYDDLLQVFAESRYYAGESVGSNPAVFEMIAATISRDPRDAKRYYRQVIQDYAELNTNPPTAIPLRAVSYGATNTIAKIMGTHVSENITSALVSPGQRVERVEQMLRT